MGHAFQDPPPLTSYLSVSDEQLLLRFYLSQASTIIRSGFGLPDVVESTAMSYLKRFYLKNSVMEWHPRIIMCAYFPLLPSLYAVRGLTMVRPGSHVYTSRPKRPITPY